jgi:hypothetical protein
MTRTRKGTGSKLVQLRIAHNREAGIAAAAEGRLRFIGRCLLCGDEICLQHTSPQICGNCMQAPDEDSTR